jgi:type II secretory pathway pseudopilin PulG
VVVLVIMGIALSIVAPVLLRPPASAERAALQVVRLLYHARRAAAEQGRSVAAELDLPGRRFRVILEAMEDRRDSALIAGTLSQFEDIVAARQDDATPAVFRFDPLGRAQGETVRLLDASGRVALVGVAPWTGVPYARVE